MILALDHLRFVIRLRSFLDRMTPSTGFKDCTGVVSTTVNGVKIKSSKFIQSLKAIKD